MMKWLFRLFLCFLILLTGNAYGDLKSDIKRAKNNVKGHLERLVSDLGGDGDLSSAKSHLDQMKKELAFIRDKDKGGNHQWAVKYIDALRAFPTDKLREFKKLEKVCLGRLSFEDFERKHSQLKSLSDSLKSYPGGSGGPNQIKERLSGHLYRAMVKLDAKYNLAKKNNEQITHHNKILHEKEKEFTLAVEDRIASSIERNQFGVAKITAESLRKKLQSAENFYSRLKIKDFLHYTWIKEHRIRHEKLGEAIDKLSEGKTLLDGIKKDLSEVRRKAKVEITTVGKSAKSTKGEYEDRIRVLNNGMKKLRKEFRKEKNTLYERIQAAINRLRSAGALVRNYNKIECFKSVRIAMAKKYQEWLTSSREEWLKTYSQNEFVKHCIEGRESTFYKELKREIRRGLIEIHHGIPWENNSANHHMHPLIVLAYGTGKGKSGLEKEPTNKFPLGNHRSNHSPAYHNEITRRLDRAYAGLKKAGKLNQKDAKEALLKIMDRIKRDVYDGSLKPYGNKEVWKPF